MDWLLDNIGKFFPLLIGLVYFLSSLKRGKEEETEQSPEAQERARRIQEEIRRKILERQGGAPTQASPDGQPQIEFLEEEEAEPAMRYDPRRPDTQQWAPPPPPPPVFVPEQTQPTQQELYEQQRQEVARKLAEARRLKKVLADKARAKKTPKKHPSISGSWRPQSLRESLRSPEDIRRAIVLKEVLDKPVSMREG